MASTTCNVQASMQNIAARQATGLPKLPARSIAPRHSVSLSLAAAHQRRTQSSKIRAAETEVEAEAQGALSTYDREESRQSPFPYPLPMEPAQQTLANIPLLVFYPAAAAVLAAVGYVGSMLGRAAPVPPKERPLVGYAVGAVTAAATAYGAVQAKKKRDDAAIIDLYNGLVDMEDPSELTAADVKSVGDRFGINMQRDQLDGLKKIYGQFLETIIPTGNEQLKGDEAGKVKAMKEALELTDEDAAPVHMEVGRRMYRSGFEFRSRQAQFEQRKAFQRLVYVSQLVFGDQKAAFLLPWRRVFNLTDAQLFVARRDNARAIFNQHMQAQGGELLAERPFLRELRDFQQHIKMFDETATELVKEYMRKHAEKLVTSAVDRMRNPGKGKDYTPALEDVRKLIEYNRRMVGFANDDDLLTGLGPVTLSGGVFDADNKRRDLRDLYKLYLDEVVTRANVFSEELEQERKELATILCLGAKDATIGAQEVSAKLYRALLREEVVSKRIDESSSPAQVLGQLCEKARFAPEAAFEMHKQLYKSKVNSLLGKKKITDEEEEELKRIRRILCINQETTDAAMKETAGLLLSELLSDIYMMGAKPVGEYEGEKVAKLVKETRMSAAVAMEVFADSTRSKLRAYIGQAQKEKDRKDSAMLIKKMVQFNSLVVTPIMDKIQNFDEAKKELAELLAKAAEEAKKSGEGPPPVEGEKKEGEAEEGSSDPVTSVQKMMKAARGDFGDMERKSQKEINLAADLDAGTRGEIYKNYLMYTMSGDVVELPVGGTIRKKTNMAARQQEMARLSQLGDLLGMTNLEINQVHQDLAEQAFKAQCHEVMRGVGGVTPEKAEYLENMRQQLNLPKETADKVIKDVRSEVLGTTSDAMDGKWDVAKVMKLSGEGVDISKALEEPQRRNLFRREFEKALATGDGSFDAEYMLTKLPEALMIDQRRVGWTVKELVGSRKRMLLVQAVSQYRQKRMKDAVTSLANLVSAFKAQPSEDPLPWNDRNELQDLFGLFCSRYEADKQEVLQKGLGLSEEEAAEGRNTAQSQGLALKKPEEEDSFF